MSPWGVKKYISVLQAALKFYMRLKTTELTAIFFELIVSSNHLKWIDDLEPYLNVRFDLLRLSRLDVSVWQRSALLCQNECSGGRFPRNTTRFWGSNHSTPNTWICWSSIQSIVMLWSFQKVCLSHHRHHHHEHRHRHHESATLQKKCYKSQAKDWSPFLNPPLWFCHTQLPHFLCTLWWQGMIQIVQGLRSNNNSQRLISWRLVKPNLAQYLRCHTKFWSFEGRLNKFER